MNPLKKLHIETPLIRSHEISLINSNDEYERNIYLKLDNCQPSGSFKIRGIANLIQSNLNKNIDLVVSSSGGNAGLAAAFASQQLNLKSLVLTPTTVLPSVVQKLKSYNADVMIYGDVWDETDRKAREICKENPSALYVSPFDDELIWKGNSSIIDELSKQLEETIPDCIICSVGGGGLILGVIEGLIQNDWINKDIKLIAVETEGANCFNESIKAGRLVTLNDITSIAKSLGAKRCASKLFDYYNQFRDKIHSIVVSDKEVVLILEKFLNDHRYLVEPSCGASLVVAYNIDKYFGEKKIKNVVVEICGGSSISLEKFLNFKQLFDNQ